MINPSIFREYDIRGIAEIDLTNEAVELIGKAFSTYMGGKGYKKFTIGRDVRLSSERIKNALVYGMVVTGAEVIDIGEVPTPILYFSIFHLKTDGGIMVTGSHNPIEFNGLKMCEGKGSIYGNKIQKLKHIIEANEFLQGDGSVSELSVTEEYKKIIKSKFYFNKKLKVVIDAGNGTAGVIAPEIFRELGCEVVCMYCEPDGYFPNHLPDPAVPRYMIDLRKKVLEKKADVGISYDGDSDRLGVIDNYGHIIFADKLLALLSKDVLKRHKGSVILFDVKCSQALPEFIEKYGGKPLMCKTGPPILKSKMKETKAPLAGEMSGHLYFADDYYGFDDAIYASGRLLEIMSNSDKKLSELINEIPYFISTPEIRIDCSDDAKFDVVADLAKSFKKQYETIDIDGARVLFGDGWGLVRASNTQPVLVLRFEARTEQRLNEIKEIFKKKLREYPVVKFEDHEF